MNITLRKLAILEKSILEKEETMRLKGFVTSPVEKELKENITNLMNRVRAV